MLDLCLTDIQGAKAKVLPRLADHRLVLCSLPRVTPEQQKVVRMVWDFRDADWEQFKASMKCQDWAPLKSLPIDDAVEWFRRAVMDKMEECVPKRRMVEHKSTRPLLDDKVLDLAQARCAAEGIVGDIEAGKTVLGYPAQDARDMLKQWVAMRRLVKK